MTTYRMSDHLSSLSLYVFTSGNAMIATTFAAGFITRREAAAILWQARHNNATITRS